MTLAVIVSAESATIAFLLAQSEITAITNRISTRLIPTRAYPQIRVQRVSGVADSYARDLPRVQIECWGEVEDENHTTAGEDMDSLSRIVAACIPRAAGWSGDIAGMEIAYGPVPLNDPVSNRSRYLLDVTFAAHEETS